MPIFFGILLVIGTLFGVKEAANLTQLSTKAMAALETHIPDDLTKAISLGSFTLQSASGTTLSGACAGSTVSLSWTPLDGAAGYTVFRGDEVAGEVAGTIFDEKDADSGDQTCYSVRGKIKHSDEQIGYVLSDQSNVVCLTDEMCAAAPIGGQPGGSQPTMPVQPTFTPEPTPGDLTPTPTSKLSAPTPIPDPRCQSTTLHQGKPVVSVAKFGNDIQKTLDCFKDENSGGGAVYIPAGTYNASKKLIIFSNTTVFGAGIDRTIIQQSDPNDALLGNDINKGTKNITVRELTLKGAGTDTDKKNSDGTTDRCCSGLQFKNLTDGYVYNVKATDFGFAGILLSYNKGSGVKNVRISESQVLNNFGGGIEIWAGSNNVIDNVTASGNDRTGIGAKKTAAINLQSGTDIGITGTKVMNNRVSNNSNVGINLQAGSENEDSATRLSYKVSGNAICKNSVSGNNDVGIADSYGQNNIYVANSISGNKDRGDGKIVICDRDPNYSGCIDDNNDRNGAIEDESSGASNPACDIPNSMSIPARPPEVLGANIVERAPGFIMMFRDTVGSLLRLL